MEEEKERACQLTRRTLPLPSPAQFNGGTTHHPCLILISTLRVGVEVVKAGRRRSVEVEVAQVEDERGRELRRRKKPAMTRF